jgi:hypothetical protein
MWGGLTQMLKIAWVLRGGVVYRFIAKMPQKFTREKRVIARALIMSLR